MQSKQSIIDQAHNEWIKDNVWKDYIISCRKCKTLIDRYWIAPDYDHDNLCGPCLGKEK